MLLSLSWLREFVPYEGTVEALGERLTMLGLEQDGLVRPYEALAPLVVGHVVECGPHPEADHLSVCRVDVGTEVLDIVCGAPNVAKGQKVVVVKVDSTLPNGLTIKAAKLRGLPSHGMICSEAEMGLSDNHDGILVLDPTAPVGKSILDALPLDREILDIGITPNRGDCLSILGLAREVAAAYGLPLTMPSVTLHEAGGKASDAVTVTLADPERTPLYLGRVLENASTAQAPAWMRYRLNAVGVRSISNVVDITNYILMELGQPLHAFDLGCVASSHVIVRSAKEGETHVTLDSKEHTFADGDIVITDPEKIIGIGGIMGGRNSEITNESSRVFLECAVFAPWQIRRTKRRLGIASEAAFRFERGVDQTLAAYALDRAAALMAEHAGATVLHGVVGAEPKPWKAPHLTLNVSRAEALIGVPLDPAFCKNSLTALGCTIDDSASEWQVTPPCRPDLTREVDLIEEIARVYGVDKVPAVLPKIRRLMERSGLPEPLHSFLFRIKHWGAAAGLNETVNYSFTSHAALDMLSLTREGRISLQNPLSEDLAVLRPVIAPGLLQAMCNSLSQGAAGVRIFEVARAFHADATSETTAREEDHLGIALTGLRHDRLWPNEKGDMAYVDLKGILEHLFCTLHITDITYTIDQKATCDGPAYLLPLVAIQHHGVTIGYAGQVKSALAEQYQAHKPVWYADLPLAPLHALYLAADHQFTPLTVFPPVRRDITFITGFAMTAETIRQSILDLGISILEEVALIDSFEPQGRDEKNLTFRLTFRHAERTLKENEADKQRDAVVAKTTSLLGVRV